MEKRMRMTCARCKTIGEAYPYPEPGVFFCPKCNSVEQKKVYIAQSFYHLDKSEKLKFQEILDYLEVNQDELLDAMRVDAEFWEKRVETNGDLKTIKV